MVMCMAEEISRSSDGVFGVFLDKLTPQARRYVLLWLESPFTLGELLEGEPDGEAVLEELIGLGAVRFVNGSAELYTCY